MIRAYAILVHSREYFRYIMVDNAATEIGKSFSFLAINKIYAFDFVAYQLILFMRCQVFRFSIHYLLFLNRMKYDLFLHSMQKIYHLDILPQNPRQFE